MIVAKRSDARYLHGTMSGFMRRFHLTCAIVASFTCVLWSAITVLAVFSWHTAPARLRLLIPILVLAGGALMEFWLYNAERKAQSRN
jgi:hypothetical protein